MKIHIHTLGCKVNQFESQALESLFTERGHIISSNETDCDVIIINTCAVTAESVRKSRQAVRHFQARNPDAVIGICGCFSQAEPETAKMLEADVVYGSSEHIKFADDIERAYNDKSVSFYVDEVFKRRAFEKLSPGSPASRTRALLKIEDGCVNFCSYCIIPYTRGPIRSLPISDIAAQAAELNSQGYREIVLTGIEIASYGKDLKDGTTISDAVCTVAENAPDCRIHLGSLEPRVITDEFCKKLSAYKNVCPHFHLSLQSGCDETLARMSRKYDTDRFYESVTLLRQYFPNCGITADLITGFPGETETEFEKTLSFIEKCEFSSIHIFPYSVRKGTAAAGLDHQVEKSVKNVRAKKARIIAEKSRDKFLCDQVGRTLSVLFEQEQGEYWAGHAENNVLVLTKGENLHNSVTNVQISAVKDGLLLGDIVL